MNYPATELYGISPPLMGGDEGEGENKFKFTPTLTLPHQGGGIKIPRSIALRNSFTKDTYATIISVFQ